MVQPISLIDLFAFLPFYLPFLDVDLRFVRVLRLLRVVRIVRIGRYYPSLKLMGQVLRAKKEDLGLTIAIILILAVFSGCFIFYLEHPVQPELFPNIPATLWWSVNILAKVSAGAVYPVTTLGKVFTSLIGILGIGLFALPTGIIVSGFMEHTRARKTTTRRCPHCGKSIR
jgi:voltage-gated potassium channel